jgi:CelD/BcsL family acetyltransferase involved in cellulose biosynthesis
MTAPTITEPACPGPAEATDDRESQPGSDPADRALRAVRRPVPDIDRPTWDRLVAATLSATPFSAWAFQRAWWDAFHANAHDETLVLEDGADEIVAIVPLMHRHEVEPSDALTSTRMRGAGDPAMTPVSPTAKAVFFGASYHADYATILTAPADLAGVADTVADYFASRGSGDWDVIDLRRLRCDDDTAEILAMALGSREMANGWTLSLEREDVCPVVTLPSGGSMDDFLATLGKKERHEIRRKVRRAAAIGEVRLDESPDPLADLDVFIEMHQRKWGAKGLFPPTRGGDQSRVFIRRLFELFGADGPMRLCFLSIGGRRIAAGVHFETSERIYYYNVGVEPDASQLSPGVLLVHASIARAIDRGIGQFDFLRGNEPYKYEWGAVDEPVQRLLVRRADLA